MAFTFDESSKKITLPIGDTLNMPLQVTGKPFVDGDVAMFAVSNTDGEDIICKTFTIENGGCKIRLNSADTADKEAGSYTWNIRLVHTPVIVDGVVQIDDSDEVVTLWNKPPKFVLVDGGCGV